METRQPFFVRIFLPLAALSKLKELFKKEPNVGSFWDEFEAFYRYDDELMKSNQSSKDAKVFKYIFKEDFFLQIDYEESLKIAFEKENEEIALHLFLFIKYIILKKIEGSRDQEHFSILNDLDSFKNILIFNQSFLNSYLKKIFELNWNNLIKFILDNYEENRFLFLLMEDLGEPSIEEHEDLNEISVCESSYDTSSDDPRDILNLVKNYQNQDFLRHKTVKDLLQKKWKTLPRFIYYLYLSIYLVFLIFYSISIENYKKTPDFDPYLERMSKYVSISFAIFFLILEIIQILVEIYTKKIFIHIFSFQNWMEVVNFSLCISALFLTNESNYVVKSSLYSITILMTYLIIIFRMDLFWKIGPYVDVIGNIIRKSLGLLVIVCICLIGFLLAFRNRSKSINENVDVVNFFNGTFEFTLIKVLTMSVGSLDTEGMGIDEITAENAINFIIYIFFILIMPVLLINIFTGISIDEVQKLIQNSEAENTLKKIEFISRIDNFMIKTKNIKVFKFIYWILYKLTFLFIILNLIIEETTKFLKYNIFILPYWKEFEQSKIKEEKEETIENDIFKNIDIKLKNMSFGLTQLSDRHENTLKYLEDLSKNAKFSGNIFSILDKQNKEIQELKSLIKDLEKKKKKIDLFILKNI